LTKLRENPAKYWRIFDAYYINVCVKFEQREKEKAYPCADRQKIHRVERAQYLLLDHSKTLVFSDVIKIGILLKYSRARAIRNYSSRAKKTI